MASTRRSKIIENDQFKTDLLINLCIYLLFHQVAANISEIMLVYVDKLRSNEISLEKKLERERKRTQRLALVHS